MLAAPRPTAHPVVIDIVVYMSDYCVLLLVDSVVCAVALKLRGAPVCIFLASC